MKPLLFCFICQLAVTGAEVFNSHEVRLDASGKLVSWVQPQEKAYDHVIRLAWDFLLEKVPVEKNGLKTFYKEQTFLEQPFIFDDSGKKSVAQAVKEAEGKVGGPIKIVGFVRYGLGEGIEKSESDFAAEVAAASGKPN